MAGSAWSKMWFCRLTHALLAKRPELWLRVPASVRVVEGQVEQEVLGGGLVQERPHELRHPRDVPPDLIDRIILFGLRKIKWEN